ncbi:MAG: oxygen-independent coproporphyrinogen III oxidase [Chloroflexaceae bacterium]|nr:oxygen-independent coproporphyrinogen III oxidase [Chloroflexaceae bacterium]NJL33370.1 oxygen-independent coproporphyrinogen III oxidase [Chloroflexaceae bacterium]NJO04186.1 oxygen-independent coproporphyrinogen III oxidase [Chloroflexaceae bacterium]
MTMLTITPDTVARYNRPGPRYTSYPTVPVWSKNFSEIDYIQTLTTLRQHAAEPLALYVHLPFCAERCHYCGCNATVTRRAPVVDGYLDRLEREMHLVTAHLGTGRRIVEMHWGGGTPNFLDAAQTRRLVALVRSLFDVAPNAELSVEVDPRIATYDQFALYRELGFRRVSLGVQDFDPAVQRAIGRLQPVEQTIASYTACRDLGFASINFDLVYGLPAQTEATFGDTLARVIELAPDRIATFSYAHVPWVKPNQKYVDITAMPDATTKLGLLDMAIEQLGAAGYTWIGLDHFALPDDELTIAQCERRLHRNFMGYTAQSTTNVLAFGMSGISDLANSYIQNDSKLGTYQKAIDAGHLPVVRGHHLSSDDVLRRHVINHLMCNLELPEHLTLPTCGATLSEMLPEAMERVEHYIDEGWLVREPGRLTVTMTGRFFLRNIAMEFDGYFQQQTETPIFSKTV